MDQATELSAEKKRMLRDEKNFFKPILRILQDNGGEVENRSQIDALVPKYTNFSEEEIRAEQPSKRSNRTYRPYLFGRNFAIKNLMLAGFLTFESGGKVKLTQKGMNINVDELNFNRDIYSISGTYWEEKDKARKNKDKKQSESQNKESEVKQNNENSENDENGDDDWRNDILNAVKSLEPLKFEQFCRGLLTRMGFEMDVFKGVSGSNDHGIDGFGYSVDNQSLKTSRVAVQCKRFTNQPVGSPDINNLRGSIDTNRADYGVFITTSYYSNEARKSSRAGSTPITLIDGDKLVDLMIKYEYKVVRSYVPDYNYFDKIGLA